MLTDLQSSCASLKSTGFVMTNLKRARGVVAVAYHANAGVIR